MRLYIAKAIFMGLGLAFSLFYACKYREIWSEPKDKATLALMPDAWKFHQRWINFFGSITGWAAAYFYIFHRIYPFSSFAFKLEDAVPILIALLGMMGFLPGTLSKIKSLT
jgi:hypothetical protein